MNMKLSACTIIAALLLLVGCSMRDKAEISQSESTPPVVASSPESGEASNIEASSFSDTSTSSPDVSIQEPGEISVSEISSSKTGSDSSYAPPTTLNITIVEGYTLAKIGMMLEDKKICTTDEFIAAAQNGDFSAFPLVAQQQANPNRCFKLEGYLFPDTYQIYSDETPNSIIKRILEHTEQKFSEDLRTEIKKSGYTVDEIITIASIIEKESFGREQMPLVSSVLHNRLNAGMRLQCDVTITYVEGAIKPFITGDVDRYNSYYNTYKCKELPAGAICNPSMDSIKAALRPENTDFLYFVTDSDKNYYYASTWEEHEENVATAYAPTSDK